MTPLPQAILSLVLCLVALPMAEGAEREPASAAREEVANPARDFREHWKLRLLPEKCPEIDRGFLDIAWSERALRDILGRGTDQFVRFRPAREPQGGREIVFTTVRHHSVNKPMPETTTTTTHPVSLGGPFLEYDGLLHTAFLSREVFLPDAVLEVADRKWYTATARRTEASDGEDAAVVITEYLFEFNEDPIAAARGTLTLQRHVRKLSEAAGEESRSSVIFVRVRHVPDERAPYELQIGTPEQRSLALRFYAGRPYALLRDEHAVWPRIYRPEREGGRE